MDIKRNGERPSGKGPEAYFHGSVRADPIVETPEPSRVRSVHVIFEPGARTAWHTHPLGQTLYVTSGFGLVQSKGGPIRRIRPGDTIFFAPGEKHWHGASPHCAMSHVAIHEALDGVHVDWMEHVTEAEYGEAVVES